MTSDWLADLRERHRAIAARLDGVTTPGEREAVRREIIAFFREVDAALDELGGVKESIRELVDRYKGLAGGPDRPTPGPDPVSGAVRSDHLGASTFIEKGWSQIALGDHAAAIATLRRALELAPDSAEAESLLGWGQMLAGDHDAALSSFSRVLTREPGNALARVNLGYLCLKRGIIGEAIEHLSRAIRLDTDRKATLYAHYYLGLVYLQREMFEDAEVFFRKALELGPNLLEARCQLGRALWFAGNRDAARQAWAEGAGAGRFSAWGQRCAELEALASEGKDIPRFSLS